LGKPIPTYMRPARAAAEPRGSPPQPEPLGHDTPASRPRTALTPILRSPSGADRVPTLLQAFYANAIPLELS